MDKMCNTVLLTFLTTVHTIDLMLPIEKIIQIGLFKQYKILLSKM